MYAQLIDDVNSKTLFSVNSKKDIKDLDAGLAGERKSLLIVNRNVISRSPIVICFEHNRCMKPAVQFS